MTYRSRLKLKAMSALLNVWEVVFQELSGLDVISSGWVQLAIKRVREMQMLVEYLYDHLPKDEEKKG